MPPHGPEKSLGLAEGVVFIGAENAEIDQIRDPVDVMDELGDPEQRMQISQPALTFLDVGLDHIALTLFQVAVVALFQFRFDEILSRA